MEKKKSPELHEEKKIERQVWNIIDQDRVVQFSDAVFAFAATLLVLKIDLPDIDRSHIHSQLLHSLSILWPQYVANIISFLVIGYYWLNHHAIFSQIKRFDTTIVWMNLIFLVFLSFIPFPVDLYGDFYNVPIVVVFYSFSLALVGIFLCVLWSYASHKHRLIHETISNKQITYYTIRMWIAPIVFLISIPLVYIDPIVAQLSWLFVICGVVITNKIFHVKRITKIELGSL